jgi:endothelin-converting enzyme
MMDRQHAFDPMGSQYDAQGKLVDWWTNTTASRFAEKEKCIVDQYSHYWVKDPNGNKVHVNVGSGRWLL